MTGAHRATRTPIVLPVGGAARPRPGLLFRRRALRGLVVSESLETPADHRTDQLRQLRLLAAIGAAVVLIEPQPESLAGAVARQAKEFGRPVFAVPGIVTRYASELVTTLGEDDDTWLAPVLGGTGSADTAPGPSMPSDFGHELVRAGVARLVRNAADVMADLTARGDQ